MAKKLSETEATVTVQVRLPAQLKACAVQLAQMDGDGDVSHWIRRQIHNAWQARAKQHKDVAES